MSTLTRRRRADWADDPEAPNDRRFSYFCLNWDSNLCLGVSPGAFDPVEGLFLQLKPYQRNYYKRTDYKKMRWDIVSTDLQSPMNGTSFTQGYLRLEAKYPTLCVDRPTATATNLKLFECSKPPLSTWIFDTEKGVLRLGDDPTKCATVAKCYQRNDPARSCLQDKNEVEINPKNFHEGSVIHAKPCYDSSPDYINYAAAQMFVRELDCVAGCSKDMTENDTCDEICNNPLCAFDKGECIDSPAPTPEPTPPPSLPPSFGSEIGDGAPIADATNLWWLIFLFLLMCCLATTALFLRSRRKRRTKAFEAEDGVTDAGLSHSHLVSDDDDNDEARFRTASAVALNQLRYHSRVASPAGSPNDGAETVKRRHEPSSNDKRQNFEEVGLV